jgi:hypothetical protein
MPDDAIVPTAVLPDRNLAMIAPVLALGTGVVSASIYGWIVLGVLIIAGDKLLWFATERAWGKFS